MKEYEQNNNQIPRIICVYRMYFTYCVMCIISTIKLGNNANSQDGIDDGSGVIQQVSTIQNT